MNKIIDIGITTFLSICCILSWDYYKNKVNNNKNFKDKLILSNLTVHYTKITQMDKQKFISKQDYIFLKQIHSFNSDENFLINKCVSKRQKSKILKEQLEHDNITHYTQLTMGSSYPKNLSIENKIILKDNTKYEQYDNPSLSCSMRFLDKYNSNEDILNIIDSMMKLYKYNYCGNYIVYEFEPIEKLILFIRKN